MAARGIKTNAEEALASLHVYRAICITRWIVGHATVPYTSAVVSTRIAKTLEKLHAGALPASTLAERAFMAGGTGAPCCGCDEIIGRLEKAYYLRVRTTETLRFHLVCHETWVRFKQPRLRPADRE